MSSGYRWVLWKPMSLGKRDERKKKYFERILKERKVAFRTKGVDLFLPGKGSYKERGALASPLRIFKKDCSSQPPTNEEGYFCHPGSLSHVFNTPKVASALLSLLRGGAIPKRDSFKLEQHLLLTRLKVAMETRSPVFKPIPSDSLQAKKKRD